MKQRAAGIALLLAVAAAIAWVRLQPARVERLDDRSRERFTVADARGREHVLLGDYDSYAWLRIARNWLRAGGPCDAIVAGGCRDELTLAPVGAIDPYARSLHPAAIAAVHRVVLFFDPEAPLASSAFLVPVIVGVLGVPPAFLFGRKLGGLAAGLIASLAIGLQPAGLMRTIGSDNDIWNLVLPLWLVWAAANALGAQTSRSQVLWATVASGLAALHAVAWRGWVFTYAIVFAGMTADLVLSLAGRIAGRHAPERDSARPGLVLLVFWAMTGLLSYFLAGEEPYVRIPFAALTEARTSLLQEASEAGVEDPWPDALDGVGELRRPGLLSIADSAGGRPLVVVAGIGLLLLVLPPPPRLRSASARGAAVLALLWFFGAFLFALRARRFGVLLTAPFGLAVGVGVGRLAAWLEEGLDRFRLPIRVVARALLVGGIAWLAFFIVQRGWSTAIAFRPSVDRPWVEALQRIRDETAADAIVISWWDYGHWIKYFAERRVAADGSTLTAQVHAWIARALAATDERQAVGLLRMIACGSDATPYPEGALGAYGKLRAAGLSDDRTRAAIEQLARVDRAQASEWLRSAGVGETSADAVLSSTHCAAPPTYLVLERGLSGNESWRNLARWHDEAGLDGYLVAGWTPCVANSGPSPITCRLRARYATNAVVESIVARPEDWGTTRLNLRSDRKDVRGYSPAEVLVARSGGSEGLEGLTPTSPGLPISVLIDEQTNRVVAGPSELLHSTFTALVFLDGRYSRYFERFDRRPGGPVTWAVRWPD